MIQLSPVIPAQAGISCRKRALTSPETTAFAGVTGRGSAA